MPGRVPLSDTLPAASPGAVRPHHHAYHERRRETMWLPLWVPHLPVFLHAYTRHPLLKFLFPGKLNVSSQQ